MLWTTSGDGTFSDNSQLNPTYTPGAADITAGSVVLTLTAENGSNCTDAIDALTLNIQPLPDAYAGTDQVICAPPQTFTLAEATAADYAQIIWSTSGDGTFNDVNALNPIYSPGANDINSQTVVLTITATCTWLVRLLLMI